MLDINRLSADEAAQLLHELIDIVPSEQLIKVLAQKLTMEQIDELIARLP